MFVRRVSPTPPVSLRRRDGRGGSDAGPGRCDGLSGQVATMLPIGGGPDRAETVAELYGEGDLSGMLDDFLRAKVWCDRAGAYVPIENRARLRLVPFGAAGEA